MTRSRGLAALAVSITVILAFAGAAEAQPIVGLSKSNQLFYFDSATPGTLGPNKAITGLNAGDSLVAIDRNPNDGVLYGLGAQSRMYMLDERTTPVLATQVGDQLSPLLSDAEAGLDFDPASGWARITTTGDQNLYWSPYTGTTATQPALAFKAGDANAGQNPRIMGIAYTHNVPGGANPKLYGYHYSSDKLVTIAGGTGEITTVGPSGVVAGGLVVGMDAAPDGTMFALLRVAGVTRLYTVETATGALSSVGAVGAGTDTTADIATDSVTNNFSFSAASYNASEADTKVTLTITRSESQGFARVAFKTADAGATAAYDYTERNFFVFFSDGETSQTVDIVLRDDVVDEPGESFTGVLSDAVGGHAGVVTPSSTVVNIDDDDTGPLRSAPITALTHANELVTFDAATPGTVSAPLAVTGLNGTEQLVAIDRRPATAQLYGLTNEHRLYRIDESSGAATQVGSGQFSPPVVGPTTGFDFDPVADQVRIVSSSSGQNLRVDPETGAVTADSPLIYNVGDPHAGGTPRPAAIGYTNNVPGATSTTLYGYEYTLDELERIGSEGGSPTTAGSGATTTIGATRVKSQNSSTVGMDVGSDGTIWALLRDQALTRLNIVNPATGVAARVGEVGTGADLYRDLTAGGVSNVIRLSADKYEVAEAGGPAKATVTRSQGLGAASVHYETSGGSASAGTDYTASSGTVAFAAGETTKEISIPVTDDAAVEGPETLTLALSSPSGGAASLGAPAAATVTISDDDKAVATPPAGDEPPADDSPPADGSPPADDNAPPQGDVPAADTTKPVVATCHKRKQRLRGRRAVRACVRSSESGSVTAAGKLKVRGVARAFKLKGASRTLAASQDGALRLKLSRKARAALAEHGRGTARLTFAVRDSAGNETLLAARIRLRP